MVRIRSIYRKTLESIKASISSKDLMEDEIVESDVELDTSDVVEPDYDPPQEMGDLSVEVTEANREAALELKSIAMDAILEGELDKARGHLTRAIILNPNSPILFASRASVFIKLKKPNAAIRDANAAIKINADFAKGYKARGMARVLLGSWEDAAKDLRMASNLDFDEETGVALKKVAPNVKKIVQHRQKYELIRRERELKKAELEKQRQEKEAEFASMLNDGQVILINSGSELRIKLNAALQISRLSVVYFTATWCGPCRYLAPVYESLAEKYPKVVFLKVDIDEARDAVVGWGLNSLPTFFLAKNGEVVDKQVQINMTSLENKIVQHSVVI